MEASNDLIKITVPEDRSRLAIYECDDVAANLDRLLEPLEQDFVLLLRNVPPDKADSMLHDFAERLGLLSQLQLQAAYATLLGHRHRIGAYRMSVNKRTAYQFIPPHSEGDSFVNMQLASFYCLDNTTDGGETILMNVDDASVAWSSLRERVTKIASSRELSHAEMKQARTLFHLPSPPELLPQDHVIQERACNIPGLKLVDVLTKARKTRSSILNRDLHAYWVSISIMDQDSLRFYVSLLRQTNLLKEPPDGRELRQLDNAAEQRICTSGVDYNKLFRCRITHKLGRGDLVIQNNLTWTHAVNNWTPGSGVRRVSAAFA